MSDTHLLPPPAPDFNAARRQYMELYGSTAVMNTYLKIAVVCLCLVCAGLVLVEIKTIQLTRNFKPLVIRINDLGRAEAVSYDTLEYHPQEAEIKYFLMQFIHEHYSRIRATVRDNYARSLYFLDGRLADAIIEANKKSKAIENFLTDQSDEIEIRVTSVAIEDLRTPPYRATVDFEKVYYGTANRAEKRREKYIANFVFIVRDHVPNAMIPINPLGLTINYFREDQAFQP
jgi:type IV secretory pathway TrbF-like protein